MGFNSAFKGLIVSVMCCKVAWYCCYSLLWCDMDYPCREVPVFQSNFVLLSSE